MTISVRPLPGLLRFVLIGLCLLLLAGLFGGCSQMSTIQKKGRQLTRELPFTGDGLRRTLAIGPVENRTPYRRHPFEKQLKDRLSTTLQAACPRVLMPAAAASVVQSALESLQPQGAVAGPPKNLVLAEAGRQAGLNAILTAAVLDISAIRQEEGHLWYKDTLTYLRVQVAMTVYDTATGAKLLDETPEHKTEVEDLDGADVLRSEDQMQPAISSALDQLAALAAERVCERLSALPWRGFVIAREGDRLVLSSGAAIGLKPGMALEIFDDSSTIDGAQGQKFFLPGLKIGEARVSAVTEWQAEAILVSGEQVKPGNSVKLR